VPLQLHCSSSADASSSQRPAVSSIPSYLLGSVLCLCLCQIVEGSCLRAWPVPVPELSSPLLSVPVPVPVPSQMLLGPAPAPAPLATRASLLSQQRPPFATRAASPCHRRLHRRRHRHRPRTAHLAQCTAQQNVQAEQYVHARRPSHSVDAVLYFLPRSTK
jgi:hypothetical protein